MGNGLNGVLSRWLANMASRWETSDTSRQIARCLILAAGALLGGTASAVEIRYTLTTTVLDMFAWDMNESGQIAGRGPEGPDEFAKRYTPGEGVTDIPRPPGVTWSYGYAINEAGHVAGTLGYAGATYDGFIFTGLDDPMQILDEAVWMNWDLPESGDPYELSGPLPEWAPYPGATFAESGQYAAGLSYLGIADSNAIAWRRNGDGTFTHVGANPLFDTSEAYGVNRSGTTVGRYTRSDIGGLFAFAYVDGVGAFDLWDATESSSRAGWTRFVSAQDVVSDGRIVGWGMYSTDGYGGGIHFATFVLSPIRDVPEPGTLALLALGLSGLGLSRRRVVEQTEAHLIRDVSIRSRGSHESWCRPGDRQ